MLYAEHITRALWPGPVCFLLLGCHPSGGMAVSPRPAEAATAAPRRASAEERIASAVAHAEDPRWPKVETTTTFVDGPLGENPPRLRPGVLTLDGDTVASDVVGARDLDVFDDGDIPQRVLPCFASEGPPVSVAFTTTRVPALAPPVDARAACIAGIVGAVDYDGGLVVRATLTASLRPLASGTLWSADADGTNKAEVTEDIAELERRLVSAHDASSLALLLATRLVDAALLQPANARESKLGRAASMYESLARDATDSKVRDAAQARLAYVAEARGDEATAIRVHRALVCPDSADSTQQDHTRAYWGRWERVHASPIPSDPFVAANLSRGFTSLPGGPQTWSEETAYTSPWSSCRDNFAESWLALARNEARGDEAAGPFRWRRAAEAYGRALRAATSAHQGALVPIARFGLARALHAEQRYRAAERELVMLLDDVTYPASPQLVVRASQTLASALTVSFLSDAPEGDPWIPRPSVLELELDLDRADAKMFAVVRRLVDPSVVPQDRRWTPGLVRWAATNASKLGLHNTGLTIASHFLTHWPLDRAAPQVAQFEVDAWKRRVTSTRGPRHDEAVAKLAAARSHIASAYAKDGAWARANKTDSDALAEAKVIVASSVAP